MTYLNNDQLIAHYEALRKQASLLDREIAAVRREIKRRQRIESRLIKGLSGPARQYQVPA